MRWGELAVSPMTMSRFQILRLLGAASRWSSRERRSRCSEALSPSEGVAINSMGACATATTPSPSSQFYISIAKPWPTQTIWWWGRGPNPGSIPGRSTDDMCWTLHNLSIRFSETLARVSSPPYIIFVKPRIRGASPPLRLYTCTRTASNSNFH